jgi:hypothetical protein
LQIDHRISYDLGFFTQKEFDPNNILSLFRDLELSNIETSSGTLKFSINGCMVSFFYYPYRVLAPFVKLDNYYMNLAALLDIGLVKVTAIADRGLKKDFIDLYFILNEIGGLKEILMNFSNKFPDANYYHYLKSLTYFEDADNTPDLQMLREIDWEDVKSYFRKEIKNIIM